MSAGYSSSYMGPKLNGGMPLVASRLKGVSTTIPYGGSISRNHIHSELPDHATLERAKDSFESEAHKRKVPHPSDEGVLPQWGHGKRSRCSRFEPAKHAGMGVQSVGKPKQQHQYHLPPPAAPPIAPAAVQANGSPAVKIRGHVAMRLAGIINSSKKEGVASRNGLHSGGANGHARSDSNGCPPAELGARHTSSNGAAAGRAGDRERERASPHNIDHGLRVRNQDPEIATTTTTGIHANNHHHHHHHTNVIGNVHSNNGNCAGTASSSEATQVVPYKQPQQQQQQQHQLQHQQQYGRVDLDTLEWARINLTLSRKEKEEDFFAIKGTKLSQRPKKRPKAVEKALHYITPGNLLIDLARGRYDVREKKCTKKKPGGLKAMEILESDSE